MDEFPAPSCSEFDWDAANAEKNWRKHGVMPYECEQVFFNQPLIVGMDEAHSNDERRLYALGRTDSGRKLFVIFTLRGERVRIISARDMSRVEREVYGHEENP